MGGVKQYWAIVLTLIWCLSPGPSVGESLTVFSGPVAIRNQFPLTTAHLSILPQTASVLPSGAANLSLSSVWSNSFVERDSIVVDSESLELRSRVRLGMGSGIEGTLELPFFWSGGGVLDRPIDWWHRAWGFPRGGRDSWPDDSYEVSGITEAGEPFDLKQSGLRLGNIVVGTKIALKDDGGSAYSALAELSLPKVSPGYGHQGVDINLGLLWSRGFSWAAFHSGVSVFWVGADEYRGIPLSTVHGEGFLSVEKPVTSRVSLLGTITAASETVTDIAGFPEYALYLDVGARIGIDTNRWLVLACRENPAPHDATTDVSFLLSFEQALK